MTTASCALFFGTTWIVDVSRAPATIIKERIVVSYLEKNNLIYCRYRLVNNEYPSEIVVFRDGVGDGQMETIRVHEAAQFESLFKTIAPKSSGGAPKNGAITASVTSKGYNPGFAFVVVQKRINTRIFSAVRGTNRYVKYECKL